MERVSIGRLILDQSSIQLGLYQFWIKVFAASAAPGWRQLSAIELFM
jgi:hypothetical protein